MELTVPLQKILIPAAQKIDGLPLFPAMSVNRLAVRHDVGWGGAHSGSVSEVVHPAFVLVSADKNIHRGTREDEESTEKPSLKRCARRQDSSALLERKDRSARSAIPCLGFSVDSSSSLVPL
jgi:hypothetical protein